MPMLSLVHAGAAVARKLEYPLKYEDLRTQTKHFGAQMFYIRHTSVWWYWYEYQSYN